MPTSASPSAMAEKTPNRMEKSRWRLYCASCSMASVRVKAPLRDLLVGRDGCNRGADGVQVGERIALGADEEVHVLPHQGGVRKVDGGDDGAIDAVVARIADDADDLTPGGALRRTGREAILKGESGNA